jgi:hypothetical protein
MKGGNKMLENGSSKALMCLIFTVTFLVWSQPLGFADSEPQAENVINAAVERTNAIKALPEKTHLKTLDGKMVPLKPFFAYCDAMFPFCCMFGKFYYWENEIRDVVSDTPNGRVKHKIRCYFNCLSTLCPQLCDPLKTHGDIAEFYDAEGSFMGLAVYMGNGKYCSLPYCDNPP